jgi:predicted RecA/RadA family phage recombinase
MAPRRASSSEVFDPFKDQTMTESNFVQDDGVLDYTPAAAVTAGLVLLHPTGRAAVVLASLAANQLGAVAVEGIFDLNSASATLFAEGEGVWWDDTNNLAVVAGTSTASFYVGRAITAKISGQLAVRVDLNAHSGALRTAAIADSAAVTNTVTETVIGTLTIPAAHLRIGRIIRFMAALIATATNSTDTFRARVRIGGVAGTIVADTGAVDLADNDGAMLNGDIVVRAVGASGKIVAAARNTIKTTTTITTLAETMLDTTAAITLVFTLVESVASASNSAKATIFNAEIV